MLILLSLGERKYRIEVGRGFETLFPNDRVAKIGAEMVPEFEGAALQPGIASLH